MPKKSVSQAEKHPLFAVFLSLTITGLLLALLFSAGTLLPTRAASPTPASQAYQTPNGFTISEPSPAVDSSGLPPAVADQPSPGAKPPRQDTFLLPKELASLSNPQVVDPVLQPSAGQGITPPYLTSFEGIQDTTGIQPPDTNGQVGPKDYIQTVNAFSSGAEVGIYDKTTGALKYPVFGLNNFYPLGNACHDNGGGDPVVIYDALADRWILTEFVNPGPPFYECFAVSKTSVPTNLPEDWWLYAIHLSDTLMNDYPKIGVWPDGYYMMAHQFAGNAWAGTGVWVFERDKMLAGEPVTFQYKNLGPVNSDYGGMLPGNLLGDTLPPPGSPNYYVEVDSNWAGTGSAIMHIFAFHTDWVNPGNTSFNVADQLMVAPFNNTLCADSRQRCIDQPSRPLSVEAIPDRLMMHAWYRNTGDHEVIVVNHTVNANGLGKAGIRWYEVRKDLPNPAAWSIYQQGTYAPDGSHRWMGSIAMDHVGNIALGYSVSSSTVWPSVRYTLRTPGDPLGTFGTEQSLVEGGSSFGGFRWGDYSSMTLDPLDDCTFWYTQEYVPLGTTTWHTRFGSFKSPNCFKGPSGKLKGKLTETGTGNSIGNASILASLNPTTTFPLMSNQDGSYAANLVAGAYSISTEPYGYLPFSVDGILISQNQTTTLNISLNPAPTVVVSGKVSNAQTGWPLYARIAISGSPINPTPPHSTAWTDPVTGEYSLTLQAGITYILEVEAFSPGYTPDSIALPALSASQVHNFSLAPDLVACRAPGYFRGGFVENFDAVTPPNLPTGWNAITVNGNQGAWYTNQGTNEPPNGLAHSAPNLVYFNSFSSADQQSSRLYRTIPVNMTQVTDFNLAFWVYHDAAISSYLDSVQVQVSTDNGLNWANVGSRVIPGSGNDWQEHIVSLAAYSSAPKLLVGFLGVSNFGYDVHLDDISLDPNCSVQAGGLVVGTLTNGDTGLPLPGSTVTNDQSQVFQSAASTDPLIGGSFYTAFSAAGAHVFTATHTGFEIKTASVEVPLNGAVRHDFVLNAGKLNLTPASLTMSVNWGAAATHPLTITNVGQGPATFEITAVVGGFAPTWPVGHLPYKSKVITWPAASNPYELSPLGGTKGSNPVQPKDWVVNTPIPTGPTVRPAAASCDGKGFYLFGGQRINGVARDTAYYNPATNTWTALTSMPVALTNMQAACIQNFIYLVGGYSGSAHTNAFQVYDTLHDTWANTTWPNIRTPMTAAYNKKLYAFGGSPGPSNETWMYDPLTNAWTNKLAPMPFAAEYGAAVTVGDYIYILGGAAVSELNKVQRYDPNNNTWSSGPDLPEARISPIAAWYGTKLYLSSGGRLLNGAWAAYNTTYSYDYAAFPTGSWVQSPDVIPQPVVGAASVCAANRIYALGGNDNRVNYGDNQALDLGLKCHYGSNQVPWLGVLPTIGTFSTNHPGVQIPLTLSFNPTVPEVTQPGNYFANLVVNNDTVYGPVIVPITMSVQAPVTWGKVTGVVSSLGYCDAQPSLLNQAGVLITDRLGVTATLTTDAQGYFQAWLDQSRSPIMLTISSPGIQTSKISGLQVHAGQVTSRTINLHTLEPCARTSADHLSLDVPQGWSLKVPFTLSNYGTIAYTWNLFEIPGLTGVPLQPAISLAPQARKLPAQPGRESARFLPATLDAALLNQGFESGQLTGGGWAEQSDNLEHTWTLFNSTSSHSGAYSVFVPWDYYQDEWLLSPPLTATGGTLSFWSQGSLYWCRDNLNHCDLKVWIVKGAPGGGDDILVGEGDDAWTADFTWAQSVFDLTPLLPSGPFRIGFEYSGSDGADIGLDDISLVGLVNGEIPWLKESPTIGIVPGGMSQNLLITFTALPTMTLNTIYTATLQIRTTDPLNNNINIPVSLKVVSKFHLYAPFVKRGP